MHKFYIPTTSAQSWKSLLADPVKHWKTGYSAKALAECWEAAQGFPEEIAELFKGTDLAGAEFLLGIPEHKVPLPGGSKESQNDLFVLGKVGNELFSMAVEGKVAEPFGPTLGEWFVSASHGKVTRLKYLKQNIGLPDHIDSSIRYQLIHRTASAVIEAKRFCASKAVMIVHSFSQESLGFDDYAAFVDLYGEPASLGKLVKACDVEGVELYFGWAKGEQRFQG